MFRTRFVAATALAVLLASGLTASTASVLGDAKAPQSHAAITAPASVAYLADLPVSMASIDTSRGIYYLGVTSGILTTWDYGVKSISKDGTLNQEFVIYLDASQLKQFQAMGGQLGPITEEQAEALSYYVVIYSQRLIIRELEAGHHAPNITFRAALRP